jgi:hypothetical protein
MSSRESENLLAGIGFVVLIMFLAFMGVLALASRVVVR